MTFILTELADYGIIMAADSSETTEDVNTRTFAEVDKIIYFSDFNIGISTWGNAEIERKCINDWLKEKIDEYKYNRSETDFKNKYLGEISEFLASKLNKAFPNGDVVLGLHITGYTYSNEYREYRPGIFHVHNHDEKNEREINSCLTPEHRNGNPTKFIAEKTRPILKCGDMLHVRNGIYEEFALFFQVFQGLKLSFRDALIFFHHDMINDNDSDPIKIQAEAVANYVRLMCNTFNEAGLFPYVGKRIRILVIQANKHRKFTLNEIIEEEW